MQIPEFPNLIHYAIPVFIATVIIEVVLTVKVKMQEYVYKDAATSIAMGLGNVTICLISKTLVLSDLVIIFNFCFSKLIKILFNNVYKSRCFNF